MPERPLLILPQGASSPRAAGQRFINRTRAPSLIRQRQRLTPILDRIGELWTPASGRIQASPGGLEPEKALVLEVATSVRDFAKAVRIEGSEFLGELTAELEPDDDFWIHDNEDDEDDAIDDVRPLDGRLYMLMTNQRGWQQVQSLWARYQADPRQRFETPLNKWKELFKYLRDVRPWGAQDRRAHTGVEEYWRHEIGAGTQLIRFEVELWFRENDAVRTTSFDQLGELVRGAGGSIVRSAVIPEIAYHAALVDLPPEAVASLLEGDDAELLAADEILVFQPLGQARVGVAKSEQPSMADLPVPWSPREDPVAAILDGLPIENHLLLRDRLRIDDPDGWANEYPADRREHGTAMASLVVHGDLSAAEAPLPSKVYVRPIMRPDLSLTAGESTPSGELVVDLVHRAVRRIFEGDGQEAPAAPSVRIVNLSIADRWRRFDRTPSAWARLLDWLSFKYNVLFVVAAGNHADGLELRVAPDHFRTLRGSDIEAALFPALYEEQWKRRLMIPAEAMNAVTVGGSHGDASQAEPRGTLVEPYNTRAMPAFFNPIASGIRRAVKPEICFPAGRQLLNAPLPVGPTSNLRLARPTLTGPGQLIAQPGPAGSVNARTYSCGTSNAAALATRAGAQIHEVLMELKSLPGGDRITRDVEAQLLKTLLVHGAAWSQEVESRIRRLLPAATGRSGRSVLARLLGFGPVDVPRVLECTSRRVTMIGSGALRSDEGHRYSIPIPEALGRRAMRRAIVTLSWFSPILSRDQRYRAAKLWVDTAPLIETLQVSRANVDARAARRGTVQHEVLEGEAAIVVTRDTSIELLVSCAGEAGRLLSPVSYALAVTLEIADPLEVDIYQEIRSAIQIPVRSGAP